VATTREVKAVVGITAVETQDSGVRVIGERTVRFDLPALVNAEHVELMQKDFEIIAGLAKEHPEEMVDLHNAILNHDFPTAYRVANQIGLNEERLVAEGGGQKGIAVGILVILVIVAIATSGDESPPPEPVGPDGGVPADGGPDGGPDAGPG
jgi:hypothetical protein